MKKLYIVANWKSNKTGSEALSFLETFKNKALPLHLEGKEVVICASHTLLPTMAWYIKTNNLPLRLGAQNISPFEEGAYTGEVNGKQIKEYADVVLIGHSERRKYFHETDKDVVTKVDMARDFGLIPIVCVQDDKTPVPKESTIIAYEPVFAIGSGTPDTPENAEKVASVLKEKEGVQYVLYGGSVTAENVHSFVSKPSIDGVLVGGASLTAMSFFSIIEHATK